MLPPSPHGVSQSEPLGRKCNALSEAKMTVLLQRVEFRRAGALCLWFCRRHTLPNCGVTSASQVICETAKLGGAKSRKLRLHRNILEEWLSATEMACPLRSGKGERQTDRQMSSFLPLLQWVCEPAQLGGHSPRRRPPAH